MLGVSGGKECLHGTRVLQGLQRTRNVLASSVPRLREHRGRVVRIDFPAGVGYASSPIVGLTWPVAIALEKDALKVTYSESAEAIACSSASPQPCR